MEPICTYIKKCPTFEKSIESNVITDCLNIPFDTMPDVACFSHISKNEEILRTRAIQDIIYYTAIILENCNRVKAPPNSLVPLVTWKLGKFNRTQVKEISQTLLSSFHSLKFP